MLMKKKELLMCLYARGHENIMGFEESEPERDEDAGRWFKACLLEKGLLESDPQNPEGYRFSAYAQVILDTIGRPEVWLEVRHLERGIRRGFFLRESFYICVEEMGEDVMVDLLPSLPVFIGGYASALKELRDVDAGQAEPAAWNNDAQLARISVHGSGEELVLEIDQQGIARETRAGGIRFHRHSQESCTNMITMWILDILQRKGAVTK